MALMFCILTTRLCVCRQDAPKRAPSAFLLWCKDLRKELREQNVGKKNVEISVLLGERWK
jgi:hypothetical protein